MCGLLGIATRVGGAVDLDDAALCRLRDIMLPRGPDDAGLLRPARHVALAHRRLAVIDPTPDGHQPIASPDGRGTLVYNGMLYNDAELRRELAASGWAFRTRCDTETVLAALCRWGPGALPRLRGMYAVAFFDRASQTLLLGRDPLGIKPMYHARVRSSDGGELLAFASDPRVLCGVPGVDAAPDLSTLSGYLTTIRTTLDDRTVYAGVRTLRPGEALEFDLRDGAMRFRATSTWPAAVTISGDVTEAVRAGVEDSVARHCRADVPVCALLSGGLDSAITATLASGHLDGLRTYCAGDPDAAPIAGVPQSEDFPHARAVAEAIGSRHAEVVVGREAFLRDWPKMVDRLGVPMSTPNEVAIHAVARVLAQDGHAVTISGEGADELFAGYAGPMAAAAGHVASGNADPGMFQLVSNAWTPMDVKAQILRPEVWQILEQDARLVETYRATWNRIEAESEGAEPLEMHLRFHRRVNLAGLLARLDTATMLASVEGRTPLADAYLARLAEAVPMGEKYRPAEGGPAETKRALRLAFADRLPSQVAVRPKASFPLPFQRWLDGHAGALRESGLVRDLFEDAAVDIVARDPGGHWALAWPMINLALWDRSRPA